MEGEGRREKRGEKGMSFVGKRSAWSGNQDILDFGKTLIWGKFED